MKGFDYWEEYKEYIKQNIIKVVLRIQLSFADR